jgi:hypothetical protein
LPEQDPSEPLSAKDRLARTIQRIESNRSERTLIDGEVNRNEIAKLIKQSSSKERQIDSLREERERQRLRIHQEDTALENHRQKLLSQQRAFDDKVQREFEARQIHFAAREESLKSRQDELEQKAIDSTKRFSELQEKWEIEKAEREAKLHQANFLLEEEKERYNLENRTRLERTSKKYVEDALDSLQKQETKFHEISTYWSLVGVGALAIGLVFFISITLSSVLVMPSPVSWEYIVFAVFKGLIAVTLLGALAKYSFLFSNSYVKEALKNADRRHAINYGKFYLESYGAAADWSQVKEAFEHWNIGGINAATQSDKDRSESTGAKKIKLESATLETVISAIEQLGKIVADLKSKQSS